MERRVEPYGLVLKAGRWYLVVGGPFGIRTYRVDQILALCPPAEFAVPEGFDLAAYGKDHVTGFRNRLHTGEALVRLTPEGGRRPGVTPPGDG
ncbi:MULTISPECIES: WYL domain-containing protein [unclassified Streptomyces]|uniref:helix-turn-helix transcriptional regulator n=1 Tax=unclassified Streptomyces TaxID=2593676 RepID=UPI0033B7FCFC